MQKIIFLCLTFCTYFLSGQAIAGHDLGGSGVPKPFAPACYATDEIEKVFIPPPAELISLKSAETSTDIVVNYESFPEDAKIAFEYAVAIWEKLIDSRVPIHIHAKWVEKGTNVLGSCRPSSYEKNFEGTPLPDIYYPVALAEKLAGKEINGPDQPDIIAEFNSDMNWYFGTDGDTPVTDYDFVSVVLHELTHGFGFIGFFFSMNGNGNFGYSRMGDATVYDLLVVRVNGDRLTDGSVYENPSVALKSALLSGDLFSNSPVAAVVEGTRPRLYSPPVWISGSSVYHLDRGTYSATDENALMRPSLARGQAVHNPGPVALGILADLGWNANEAEMISLPEIVHEPVPFYLDQAEPMPVEVLVHEAGTVDSIFVEYALNGVPQKSFGLVHNSETFYSANFPLTGSRLNPGDEIAYRIVTVHGQSTQHIQRFPDDGQYAFRVEEMLDPVSAYQTDFEDGMNDFFLGGFSIAAEEGFTGNALHSAHPYSNSNETNRELHAVSYLKYPIVLTSGIIMSFDEVVLVEPGVPGAVYGTREFADYVIVEASSNHGETWIPLVGGYDSGDQALWKDIYTSSVVNKSSAAVASEELFVNRRIDLLQENSLNAGDTIIIRFRLSANAEVNGWGWAVDNLSIQTLVAAPNTTLASASFSAYPNPFQQRFKISADSDEWIDRLEFDLYNTFGQKVWSEQRENVTGKMAWDVDVNSGFQGIYLLVVSQNGEKVYTQKMICN